VGDLTAGDFWGIDRKTLNEAYDGRVSVLIISTKKGVEAFNSASASFCYENRTLNEAVCENVPLHHPTIKSDHRRSFVESYKQNGFYYAVNQIAIPKPALTSRIHSFAGRTPIGKLIKKVRKLLRGGK
jgi:hypothetical protein